MPVVLILGSIRTYSQGLNTHVYAKDVIKRCRRFSVRPCFANPILYKDSDIVFAGRFQKYRDRLYIPLEPSVKYTVDPADPWKIDCGGFIIDLDVLWTLERLP